MENWQYVLFTRIFFSWVMLLINNSCVEYVNVLGLIFLDNWRWVAREEGWRREPDRERTGGSVKGGRDGKSIGLRELFVLDPNKS